MEDNNKTKAPAAFSPSIEDLLFNEITVGGDVLDRELFYQLTKDMSPQDLDDLQERVRARALSFYDGLYLEELKRTGKSLEDFPRQSFEKDTQMVDKQLHSWFREWTRLAGRIDDAITRNRIVGAASFLDEELLSTLCALFARSKEYEPYKDRELKGYVFNKCIDNSLDYMKVAEALRDKDLEKTFMEKHPYLNESGQTGLLKRAYEASKKADMPLSVPSYNGERINISSFLPLSHCYLLPQGQPTAIAFTYNPAGYGEYVVFDDNGFAIPVEELSPWGKKVVFENVYDQLEYIEKSKSKNINDMNDEITTKQRIQIIPYEGDWSRQEVAKDSANLYIFTDNTDRDSGKRVISRDSEYYRDYGDGEHDLHFPTVTSAVIRGLANALPVSTQHWYHDGAKGEKGRWNDSDLAEFRSKIAPEFEAIREKMWYFARHNESDEPLKVFLPGNSLTGGKISAITEIRTPKLYAYLKDREASLQFTADLYQELFVNDKTPTEDLRKIAYEVSKQTELPEYASPAEWVIDRSRDELKYYILMDLPGLPQHEREMLFSKEKGFSLLRPQEPVVEEKAARALESYSAYQLTRLLDEVIFPEKGKDAEFDSSLEIITAAMAEGWTEGKSEDDIKKYILNTINGLPEKVRDFIEESAADMNLAPSVFDKQNFDVYTVGFSTKSIDEFRAALPPRTEVLIDIRKSPSNRYQTHFNKSNLPTTLRSQGIAVVYIPENSPTFFEDLRAVILEHPGKVVIASSESQAGKSIRGRELGPKLERSGISVGHISQSFNAEKKTWNTKPDIRSQETITSYLLGNQYIADGSYKNITFGPDGKIVSAPGVTLKKKERKESVDRNIRGAWNYGKAVEVTETELGGYSAAVKEISSKTNVNLMFYSPHRRITPPKDVPCVSIKVPEDKDDLLSKDYARKVVDGMAGSRNVIRDNFNRFVISQKLGDPDNIDLQNLTVGVFGSNIVDINNRRVYNNVTDEELSMGAKSLFYDEMGGYDAGNSITVKSSDIEQEDLNVFVRNVIEALNTPPKRFDLEKQDEQPQYTITGILSVGETGAGIAGAIAGQELGMNTGMQALRGFEHTIDDETLYGKKLRDKAALCNHLHLGYKNALTKDELLMQIDHVHEAGQRSERAGLNDRQVMVLAELGFSNSDILTITEQAAINNYTIKETPILTESGQEILSGREGLLELIEICREGYGVKIDIDVEMTEENILAAEINVAKQLNNDRRNGIGVITVANPFYPSQLRSFEGFTSITEEEGYVVGDGVVSAGIIRREQKEERPAILRYKGNIDALSQPSVSIVGNISSSEEAKRMAELVGHELGAENLAVVTSLRRTELIGHNSIVKSRNILGEEKYEANIDEALKVDGVNHVIDGAKEYDPDLKVRKTAQRSDSQTVARNAAIDTGSIAIVVSPNGLNYREDADQIERVVASGGIVLSEAGFDADEGSEKLHERAGYLSCALGGSAILIDGKAAGEHLSPTDELSATKGQKYVVQYKGLEGVNSRIKGNEDLIHSGAPVVELSGKGIEEIVATAKSVSPEENLDAFLEDEARKAEEARKAKEERHVDRLRLSVVRKGTEQVFIVPSEYVDVRQALKNAYGDNIKFSESLGLTKRNLGNRSREVDGERVHTFNGYRGTEIMSEPVYSVPLFYAKGEIYSLYNAPNDTPGLIPLKRRIENRDLLEQFKATAESVRRELMVKMGMPKETNIRFENAMYPVVTQNAVEIYQGSELRASVSLEPSGSLRIKNYEKLSDDFNDYRTFSEAFFNELDSVHGVNDKDYALRRGAMKDLGDKLREKIVGIEGDAENLDVASSDITKGIRAGLIAEPAEDGQEYNRETALGFLATQEASTSLDLTKLGRESRKLDKNIADQTAKREAAYNDALAPSEFKEIEDTLEEMTETQQAIKGRITELRTKLGILQEQKERIVLAEKVCLAKGTSPESSSITLYVDGLAMSILPGKIRKNTPWEEILSYEKSIKETHEREQAQFREGIEKIENNSATLKNIGELYDKRHESSKGVAQRSEIVPDSFLNGRYIIERDGKKAYADENLNIRSDFYDDLKPWNGRHGLATKDGKHNFINPAGEPIVCVWFDERSKTSEGVFVVKVEDKYGLIDENGSLVGDRLFANVHSCHDGWAVVMGGPEDGANEGKFNYIGLDGKLMGRRSWFDQASDFVDGKATIVVKGTTKEIDKTGAVIKNDNGMEGPGTGKGRGR